MRASESPTGGRPRAAPPPGGGGPNSPGADESVRVAAGAKDVVLVVDLGLVLAVRIENWPADGPTWHAPTLSVEGESPRFQDARPTDGIGADGTISFRGLQPDETYRLWVPPLKGLSLLATGLRAGGTELRVRLVPGRTITGRIVAPEGRENLMVSASGLGVSAVGTLEPDGRYKIEGLPEGEFDVSVWCQKGSEWWTGSARVAAGGSADIEVKKP